MREFHSDVGYIGSDGKNTGMIYSLPASYAIIRCNLV